MGMLIAIGMNRPLKIQVNLGGKFYWTLCLEVDSEVLLEEINIPPYHAIITQIKSDYVLEILRLCIFFLISCSMSLI